MSINPVIIADYDPQWPVQFQQEYARLRAAVGDAFVSIDHAGSTAVPNLAAKPIIDIFAGVRDLADVPPLIPPLEALDYEYVPENERDMPMRRYFRRRIDVKVNLHIWSVSQGEIERYLLFRDYLREHPVAASQYAALKRELALHFRDDRDAYTEAKTEFVTDALRKALVWREVKRP